MKTQIEQMTTTTVASCDKCGCQQKHMSVCQGCRQDICDSCRNRWSSDPFTGADNGDYSEYACGPCNLRAATYIRFCLKLRLAYEAQLEQAQASWRRSCKLEPNTLQPREQQLN